MTTNHVSIWKLSPKRGPLLLALRGGWGHGTRPLCAASRLPVPVEGQDMPFWNAGLPPKLTAFLSLGQNGAAERGIRYTTNNYGAPTGSGDWENGGESDMLPVLKKLLVCGRR